MMPKLGMLFLIVGKHDMYTVVTHIRKIRWSKTWIKRYLPISKYSKTFMSKFTYSFRRWMICSLSWNTRCLPYDALFVYWQVWQARGTIVTSLYRSMVALVERPWGCSTSSAASRRSGATWYSFFSNWTRISCFSLALGHLFAWTSCCLIWICS